MLLCKDPVYDILYYVNYGIDYYIYRVKNGISELAVELPARRLFTQNGILYFILAPHETYSFNSTELAEGNIISYNPLTGDVIKIIDTSATSMYVYEDGIYYKNEIFCLNEDGQSGNVSLSNYYYSFESNSITKIENPYTSISKWNDYHVTNKVEPVEGKPGLEKTVSINLETLDKSKSILITDQYLIPNHNYSIIGDRLVYRVSGKAYYFFDMESQTTEEILMGDDYSGDYTIIGNYIYQDSLLRIDMITGEHQKISTNDGTNRISELYTDGKNLFGICMGSVGSKGVMRRIIYEEVESENAPIILTQMNGIQIEHDKFYYKTIPMGDVE